MNGARATETAQRLGELSALAKNLSQAAHHYCMESRGSNTLLHLCGQLHACAHIPTQTDRHINYLIFFLTSQAHMVAHACNLSTWKVRQEDHEFQANMGYRVTLAQRTKIKFKQNVSFIIQ